MRNEARTFFCVHVFAVEAGARFYCPFYLFVCLSVCLLAHMLACLPAWLAACSVICLPVLVRCYVYLFTHSIFGKRLPLFIMLDDMMRSFGGLPIVYMIRKRIDIKWLRHLACNIVYIAIGQCLHTILFMYTFCTHSIFCTQLKPNFIFSSAKKRVSIEKIHPNSNTIRNMTFP